MLASSVAQLLQVALAHHRSGHLGEAEAAYRTILARQPAHADALHLLGVVALEMGRMEEAVTFIERAVSARPDEPIYLTNLGIAYRRLGKIEAAIASLSRAVALSPNFANAHGGLGHALLDGGRPKEAIAALQQAIALDATFPEAHANLADAYATVGQFQEATVHYRRSIALQPNNATARSNFALLLLRLGHYHEGWREYEWRLGLTTPLHELREPRWDGKRASGKTILVHAEQGFGDTIHFLRYLPLARARSDAQVILECQPELNSLVAHERSKDAKPDFHIPLLSLPLVLEQFEPLPMTAPYLHADPVRVEEWRARLGPKSAFRVGVAWAGSAAHKDDARRSISPEMLRPILSTADVSFYSLQTPPQETELIDFTAHIVDFADTAAFVMQLDLIITVDTAVAHLAGALGRPVWVLFPFVADWRWGVQGEETPWYPTMRLFRQHTTGDWDRVIRRVADVLSMIATKR